MNQAHAQVLFPLVRNEKTSWIPSILILTHLSADICSDYNISLERQRTNNKLHTLDLLIFLSPLQMTWDFRCASLVS